VHLPDGIDCHVLTSWQCLGLGISPRVVHAVWPEIRYGTCVHYMLGCRGGLAIFDNANHSPATKTLAIVERWKCVWARITLKCATGARRARPQGLQRAVGHPRDNLASSKVKRLTSIVWHLRKNKPLFEPTTRQVCKTSLKRSLVESQS
jgi:hypothetical protein